MNAEHTQTKANKIPLILSACLVGGLVLSYFLFPAFHDSINEAFEVLTSKDEERIATWVSRFGAWGPIAIVVGMVLQMFFFVVPNILLIFICVISYGPVWGGLLAWLGIYLASTTGYFIGRRLSHVIVDRFVSTKTQNKLREFIRTYGMKAIIALRLSSISNDGLSLVAGLLKMKYRRFIVATMIGVTPLITVIAVFGHNGRIERALIGVGVFLLVCLVVYVVVDKRREKKRDHFTR